MAALCQLLGLHEEAGGRGRWTWFDEICLFPESVYFFISATAKQIVANASVSSAEPSSSSHWQLSFPYQIGIIKDK